MIQSISMQRDSDTQMLQVWLKRSLHAQFDGIVQEPVPDAFLRLLDGVGTQNGPRYTLRFCRAFDGAHLAKRSERGGWRIGIGPEVIAGEIDMLPTER